jgi:hypothetical protein
MDLVDDLGLFTSSDSPVAAVSKVGLMVFLGLRMRLGWPYLGAARLD